MTLTLKFDLLVKNFNHGLYLMMVAARRASLSSDNSCYVTIRSLHGVRPWHDRDYSRCSEFVNTINAFKWL